MEITIIGTGNMARGIGTRAIAGGHTVNVIGKDREQAEEVAAELGDGAQAADSVSGEVVVLAVYYGPALDAIEQHGDALDGKVLVDITNPVKEDFSGVVDLPAGSAAQEIAAAAPAGASVVKAFNTTFAGTLVEGEVNGQQLDVFLASDDEAAKSTVRELVESGGLRVVDAGPLASARYLEAAGFLHMRLQDSLGTGYGSALKIVP
jgi:8-hydroxy-5-deazaflavin:NADPH oxidoreductase